MSEEPLLRVDCFEVVIGDLEIGFAQVGPLESLTDVDGREPVHRFATVHIRRALTTSSELFEWRRRVMAGNDERRDVTIRQLSAPGGSVVNAWRLVRAWPSRWTGPSFNAMRGDIAFEELELAFDDLVWLAPRGPRNGD